MSDTNAETVTAKKVVTVTNPQVDAAARDKLATAQIGRAHV